MNLRKANRRRRLGETLPKPNQPLECSSEITTPPAFLIQLIRFLLQFRLSDSALMFEALKT